MIKPLFFTGSICKNVSGNSSIDRRCLKDNVQIESPKRLLPDAGLSKVYFTGRLTSADEFKRLCPEVKEIISGYLKKGYEFIGKAKILGSKHSDISGKEVESYLLKKGSLSEAWSNADILLLDNFGKKAGDASIAVLPDGCGTFPFKSKNICITGIHNRSEKRYEKVARAINSALAEAAKKLNLDGIGLVSTTAENCCKYKSLGYVNVDDTYVMTLSKEKINELVKKNAPVIFDDIKI